MTVSTFTTAAKRTFESQSAGKHGPLPLLLVAMTVVTGLVDAFSYLVLGHVFVANMTGNVVFLAFALVGAKGFSIGASLAALAFFGFGALTGGFLSSRMGWHRGHLLAITTTIETVLIGISVILAALAEPSPATQYRYLLILLLAFSMGAQNACARKLAVPDLTTTVLTLTIVGVVADTRIVGGKGSRSSRRLVSITALFIGALLGATFVLHVRAAIGLGVGLVIMALVASASQTWGKDSPAWTRGEPPAIITGPAS